VTRSARPPTPTRHEHHEAQAEGDDQVAVGRAERIAEQELAQPGRGVGRQRERDAEPEQRADRHRDGELRADAPVARRERDEQRGRHDPARRSQHDRQAGQRREHEPGQHRVGQRLGRVRVTQVQDPDAQRAADDPQQHDLGQGPAQQLALQQRHQPWWWWEWTATVSGPRLTISSP
jgi:hypothetical protein